MPRTDTATLIAALTQQVAALAASVAAMQPATSAPVTVTSAQPTEAAYTGKTCRDCGHEHKRPVREDLRARLADETACAIKGCVSVTCGR